MKKTKYNNYIHSTVVERRLIYNTLRYLILGILLGLTLGVLIYK
jgi:hypothetical protein